MLALFHDKKCCNCINFIPCILLDFIVLGLVISWSRIKHEMKNQCYFTSVSKDAYSRKRHVKSICWKLKCHDRLSV